MDKVLIYMQRPLLKPTGGPTGYCYNLATQLEKRGEKNIHFIESVVSDVSGFNNRVKNIRCNWLRFLITIAKSFYRKTQMLYGLKHKAMVDLNEYDVVHFHSTDDMFQCRDSLKTYKGKVVLTSHSPTILSKEYFSYLTPWEQKYMRWYYKKMIRMDEYAFNRADYIFFPCEEAEEPYHNNWNDFGPFKEKNTSKFRYLLSGINPCQTKVDKKDVRQKYGIPESAFVVCYVGRHNELKGYDTLKKIGEALLKQDDVYVLVAGKEEPMKGLEHPRWIEVGWTNDPHSIIAASDVFILPNRETYFDLVLLEVLSLGKIVVASYTGGNRYFDKLKPNGILNYKNAEDALECLSDVKNMSSEECEQLEVLNKRMFDEYFTSEVFAENYVRLLESL